jgi:hypothetical protein
MFSKIPPLKSVYFANILRAWHVARLYSTIRHDRRNLDKEETNLRHDLQLNGYPRSFVDSVINSKDTGCPKKEEDPLFSVYIPYVKGISENFKRISNLYNIRIIFRTKHTLGNSLMKTKPKRDMQ